MKDGPGAPGEGEGVSPRGSWHPQSAQQGGEQGRGRPVSQLLTRFTLGELMLLLLSLPFPVSCSFTATSWNQNTGRGKACKRRAQSSPVCSSFPRAYVRAVTGHDRMTPFQSLGLFKVN